MMKRNINTSLNKYFKYDKLFNLHHYDEDMTRLYDELKSLKKEHYENNYRFIFLHYDTDYYITKNQPGVLLRNLQRVIWSLDISNYFCLVLSQQDLQAELDQLAVEETSDEVSIACITHSLQNLLYLPKDSTDVNSDGIDRHYICLNRIQRFHRICMFSLLQHNQLLDKGVVSLGPRS